VLERAGGLLETLGEYAAEQRRQALASAGFTRRQLAQRQLWFSTFATLKAKQPTVRRNQHYE
jgi:hypothetical protein